MMICRKNFMGSSMTASRKALPIRSCTSSSASILSRSSKARARPPTHPFGRPGGIVPGRNRPFSSRTVTLSLGVGMGAVIGCA